MTNIQYTLVGTEDGSNISVFVPGHDPQVAHSSHPNFDAILDGVLSGDVRVIELFDVAQAAANRFERITERITTANGNLYFDGVEIHNTLATQVTRFMKDGVEDWIPLVKFFEHVQNNPNDHSRSQLFDWLDRRDFTITQDGMIVGYKGVAKNGNGEFVSVHSGQAIVNGVVHKGQIPNPIGAVIEMPRDQVVHDPSKGCHRGLHVGTYDFAKSYAHGAMLEVHVNPRDVVSVPTDSDWAKVRTCRYRVVRVIDNPYSVAVVGSYDCPVCLDDDDACDCSWGDSDY